MVLLVSPLPRVIVAVLAAIALEPGSCHLLLSESGRQIGKANLLQNPRSKWNFLISCVRNLGGVTSS